MIALLLLLQTDFAVSRIEKAEYGAALKKCRDAEALLESDPRAALDLLEPLLAAPPAKIEGRLRIETRPGEFSEPQPFTPYQLRGRALLAVAAKDPAAADKLLRRALEDFELSVRKGVAGSQPFALEARKRLDALQAAPPPAADPEPALRAAWSELLRARRFRDARALVEKDGAFLAKEKRETYLKQTDEDCRARVAEVWLDFLRELRLASPASIEALGVEELGARFALPDLAQLCVPAPELEWAVGCREILDRLRRREDVLDALLAAAAAARDEAFGPVAELAGTLAGGRVRQEVEASRTAPRAERDRRAAAATAVRRKWAEWSEGLPAERRERVKARDAGLDALLAQIPVDLEDARRAGESLDATFASDRPAADLDAIERQLAKLHAEQESRLSLESRRELLSHLLAAAALRRLLEGKSAEQVAALPELAGWASELKQAGGRIDLSRFGPKLGRVLARLGL